MDRKTSNRLLLHCDNCRWWRFSRTDNTNVCVNPKSNYYGEEMDPEQCCIDYEKKKTGGRE